MRILILSLCLIIRIHGQCTNETCLYGHCVNGKCICDPGVFGATCNKDIIDCDSSSCLNNGKCIELVNGFACQCLPEFDGSRCQHRRVKQENDCKKKCQHNSKCVVINNTAKCLCPPTHHGSQCEHTRNTTSARSVRKCSLVKLRNSPDSTTCIAIGLTPLFDVHCECQYSSKNKNTAVCHITPSPYSDQKCSFKKHISLPLLSTLPDPIYIPVCPVNWEILDQYENTEEKVNSVHSARCQLYSI